MENILSCKGLTKCYGKTTALNQVDFNVERGKIVGLLGANGSGKTTLIKVAAGLLTPTEGEITIAGMPIGAETKKIVAYLPERTYLNTWNKVKDDIAMFEDFYEDFQKEKAYDMLKSLGIDPNERLKNMSKGTREKVQLILVMSREADLYLLDEPIGGVDPVTRDYILSTIINNYNENASVLISTHLIADIENILDDVAFMRDGKIILHDSVEAIRFEEEKSLDAYFREVYQCSKN